LMARLRVENGFSLFSRLSLSFVKVSLWRIHFHDWTQNDFQRLGSGNFCWGGFTGTARNCYTYRNYSWYLLRVRRRLRHLRICKSDK
jgi:hypothetical protein